MKAGSRTKPCAQLREEIRQLEDEVQALDAQLKQASARIEIPAGALPPRANAPERIDPSPDLFASPPRIDRESRSKDAVAEQLRRGIGAASAPYRKVAFSNESRKAQRGWSSRLGRWAGMVVVLGGIAGIWVIATRPGPAESPSAMKIEDESPSATKMEDGR